MIQGSSIRTGIKNLTPIHIECQISLSKLAIKNLASKDIANQKAGYFDGKFRTNYITGTFAGKVILASKIVSVKKNVP